MKIVSYNLEIDDSRHPIMVAEKEYLTENNVIKSSDDVIFIARNILRLDRMAEEYLYMLCLSNCGEIIGIFQISHGNATTTACGMREIASRILLCGAVSIILIHNHPSGDVTPSKADDNAVKAVKATGDLLNIKLLDSIIIGNGYYSYCEMGRC